MNDMTANAVLFALYIFTILPLVGVVFGGKYNSYGKNDGYANCVHRGITVHFLALCLCLVVMAINNKIN